MKQLDIFALPVHSAADVFPMLAEDELEELAAHIKAHGLQYPLAVQEINGEPVLIDGRNRRDACRRAGIVPKYEVLNGQDPIAWIIGANVNRRNISKGQMAMAVAKIFPEPEKLKRKGAGSFLRKDLSEVILGKARTVLAHAPKLVDQVLTGGLPLNEAYETAKTRKAQEELFEGQLAKLREQAPDLADLVEHGQMSLTKAQAELDERIQKERRFKYGLAATLSELAARVPILYGNNLEDAAQFIVHETKIYEDYAKRPIDEVFEALQTFHERSNLLLERVAELKAKQEEEDDAGIR